MKDKKKQCDKWKDRYIKVTIRISCPVHSEIGRTVLLNEYTNKSLEQQSRKKMWFCKKCGKRLRRNYDDVNFIIPESFNTRSKK